MRNHALNASGQRGWFCIKHGPGCLQCYAEALNIDRGNGLPFVSQSLKDVSLKLFMDGGQSSVDWPLRATEPRTIFLGSMTDWMAKFYPPEWQSLLLATMSLATQHTFITLTKRVDNLFSMLGQIDATPNRTIRVPADKAFTKAILRANMNEGKLFAEPTGEVLTIQADIKSAAKPPVKALTPWEESVDLPWPPRNIIFGISVCTAAEADRAVPILTNVRAKWPDIKLMISQEPALDVIDWEKAGLRKGVIDWLVWGGESGPRDVARPVNLEGWDRVLSFGANTGTPVYFKQTGNVLAKELGLKAPKGDDINEEKLRGLCAPIREEIDMTGRLV